MTRDSDILTTKEAAGFLKAHIETLRRLARRAEIPAFKVGKDWRFRREALLCWADEHHLRSKPPRILIVDDDPGVRDLVGRLLEADGYHPYKVPSGEKALAYLENETVSLILLDLKMPRMNGPEFLFRLQKTGRRPAVIVITGYPDSDIMMEAMRYGPITLVAKPFKREELLQAVRTALGGASDARGFGGGVSARAVSCPGQSDGVAVETLSAKRR